MIFNILKQKQSSIAFNIVVVSSYINVQKCMVSMNLWKKIFGPKIRNFQKV